MGILGTALIGMLGLGGPIALALIAATVGFIIYDPLLSENAIFRSFFSFVNKYTLMAIPFFIYAGFLMERTGLIAKLFRFADALVGWVPGGFAYATILSAVMFGAISGSSTAMAAAMGVIAYPEMIKRGYPIWMAAGVIATGGGIAILIPPSITLILYGVLTEESIVKLFLAGVMPGIMLAISDAVIVMTMATIIKLPANNFKWSELRDASRAALPALLMPVFVLGGLYGGVLTPTESGAGACAYALIYGFLSMRRKFLKEMFAATERAVNLTAILFFLLGGVGIFQFLLANQGWPQDIATWVTNMGLPPIGFLAALLLVLLFLSMFLTGVAILVLVVPVIYPVSLALGIDPIHLGVLFALCIEMGAVIPPVGLNLFAVSGTTGVPVTTVMRGSFPFLCTDGCVLILCVLFPILTLWLPNLVVKPIFG
ncbi:MAG: TRAP transporter large permease [Alphaproteobacteria bacterium]|jgi:C4-dicarboxylate transporter, DctM subunit|nr:TRAP transporter large permease [Alphaproteobacteria bacterium]